MKPNLSIGPVIIVDDNYKNIAPSTTEKHYNAKYPPKIKNLSLNAVLEFDKDGPNGSYQEIDAAIKLKITIATISSAPAIIASIRFGSEYTNSQGAPLPPIVIASDESGIGLTSFWRPLNVTSTGFEIYADFGLNNPGLYRVRYTVAPAHAEGMK